MNTRTIITAAVLALSALLLTTARAQQPEGASEGRVRVAMLTYGAERKTSVCFADHFLRDVAIETDINIDRRFTKIDLDSEELFAHPFAVMTGEGSFELTEQEIANRSEVAQKQPDVVWVHASGKRCAVEVELTAKWGRQFDQFVSSCLLALAGTNARYDLIALISDSPAILRRYAAAFEPGYRYRIWERDARGHWQSVGTREVPAWARERVLCKRVD